MVKILSLFILLFSFMVQGQSYQTPINDSSISDNTDSKKQFLKNKITSSIQKPLQSAKKLKQVLTLDTKQIASQQKDISSLGLSQGQSILNIPDVFKYYLGEPNRYSTAYIEGFKNLNTRLMTNFNATIPSASSYLVLERSVKNIKQSTLEHFLQYLTENKNFYQQNNISFKQLLKQESLFIGLMDITLTLLEKSALGKQIKQNQKKYTQKTNFSNFFKSMFNYVYYSKLTKKQITDITKLSKIIAQNANNLWSIKNQLKKFCSIPENVAPMQEFIDSISVSMSDKDLNAIVQSCGQIFGANESPYTRQIRRYKEYKQRISSFEFIIKLMALNLIQTGIIYSTQTFLPLMSIITPLAMDIGGNLLTGASRNALNLGTGIALGDGGDLLLSKINKLPFVKLLFVRKDTLNKRTKGVRWTQFFTYISKMIYFRFGHFIADPTAPNGKRFKFIPLHEMSPVMRRTLEKIIITIFRNHPKITYVNNYLHNNLCKPYGLFVNQVWDDINFMKSQDQTKKRSKLPITLRCDFKDNKPTEN